jgi:hypothetical protein
MQTHHEDTANSVYAEYRWRSFDPADLSVTDGTAQEAAEAMQLAVTEVEWACEEYGRCDTPEIVCWKPGDIEFGVGGEPIGGGFEWPATEAPIDPAEDHAEFVRQHPKDDTNSNSEEA